MAGGSAFAVYSALVANSVVAVAKLVGFALTGSGAMLSEGLHSVADVGNQALLAVGLHKAARPPDEEYPFGYGREAFVWALISAVGMFFLGCGVSIAHGIEALLETHPAVSGSQLNLAILGGALVLESASMAIAIHSIRGDAAAEGKSLWAYFQTTEDPIGVAVLLEDGAAVFGVFIALAAVGLASITGDARWDAVGTLAVAGLMGWLAVYLIQKNRGLIVGRAVNQTSIERFVTVMTKDSVVDRVVHHRSEVTGATTWTLAADVAFNGAALNSKELTETDVPTLRAAASDEAARVWLDAYTNRMTRRLGIEIERIEETVRAELPKAVTIHIEPD